MQLILFWLLFVITISLHLSHQVQPKQNDHSRGNIITKACFNGTLPYQVCLQIIKLRVASIDAQVVLDQAAKHCVGVKKQEEEGCLILAENILENAGSFQSAVTNFEENCKSQQISKTTCQTAKSFFDPNKPGSIGTACIKGGLLKQVCFQLIKNNVLAVDFQDLFVHGLQKCILADKKVEKHCSFIKELIFKNSQEQILESQGFLQGCKENYITKPTCDAVTSLFNKSSPAPGPVSAPSSK